MITTTTESREISFACQCAVFYHVNITFEAYINKMPLRTWRHAMTDQYGVVELLGNRHEVVKRLDVVEVCRIRCGSHVFLWEDVMFVHLDKH
jgi:hypothetical protein